MTMRELRQYHTTLYNFIINEKKMRERVFPNGHPNRDTKLLDCDQALAALEAIKNLAKTAAEPEATQGALFDVPLTHKPY